MIQLIHTYIDHPLSFIILCVFLASYYTGVLHVYAYFLGKMRNMLLNQKIDGSAYEFHEFHVLLQQEKQKLWHLFKNSNPELFEFENKMSSESKKDYMRLKAILECKDIHFLIKYFTHLHKAASKNPSTQKLLFYKRKLKKRYRESMLNAIEQVYLTKIEQNRIKVLLMLFCTLFFPVEEYEKYVFQIEKHSRNPSHASRSSI